MHQEKEVGMFTVSMIHERVVGWSEGPHLPVAWTRGEGGGEPSGTLCSIRSQNEINKVES